MRGGASASYRCGTRWRIRCTGSIRRSRGKARKTFWRSCCAPQAGQVLDRRSRAKAVTPTEHAVQLVRVHPGLHAVDAAAVPWTTRRRHGAQLDRAARAAVAGLLRLVESGLPAADRAVDRGEPALVLGLGWGSMTSASGRGGGSARGSQDAFNRAKQVAHIQPDTQDSDARRPVAVLLPLARMMTAGLGSSSRTCRSSS